MEFAFNLITGLKHLFLGAGVFIGWEDVVDGIGIQDLTTDTIHFRDAFNEIIVKFDSQVELIGITE